MIEHLVCPCCAGGVIHALAATGANPEALLHAGRQALSNIGRKDNGNKPPDVTSNNP